MNKEIRDQWADALESGDYKQCQGQLATRDADGNESFCCLGVLTELAVKAGVAKRNNDLGLRGMISYQNGAFREWANLPSDVRDWAGLDSLNPTLTYVGLREMASTLNDTYGLPFSEIAKLIREQL